MYSYDVESYKWNLSSTWEHEHIHINYDFGLNATVDEK